MSEQFKSPLEEIIYLRRYLHINPELSFQEFNTQKTKQKWIEIINRKK